MTDTKTKQETAAPQAAPAAQLPAKATAREAWEGFRDELNKRADEIGSQLPSNVSRDRFLNASIAAVKATPGILTATPRSLFSALTKAAQDGLVPDGREGIITVFSQKVPNTTPQQYENVAQWNPMFYGLRKRARELDGIIIDAQVVVDGDEFDYELGDEPRINHKPKARAEVIDASKGIAVYAIFRHPEQGILHREVMWKPEVFAVMNQSRAKTSLMWTTFWTEGWRKTVGRRGAKSVPVSAALERLITRDDENFDFPRNGGLPAIEHRASPPPPPPEDEPEPAPPPTTQKASEVEPQGASDLAGDFNDDDSGVVVSDPAAAFMVRLDEELAAHDTEDGVVEAFELSGVDKTFEGNDPALERAYSIRERHLARVNGQGDLLGDVPAESLRLAKIAGTP